jgi:uncharacterized membrane protein
VASQAACPTDPASILLAGSGHRTNRYGVTDMLLWIVILAVLLLLFGGVGYGNRASWGNYYGGGVGLVGLILIIVFIIWALGGFK